MRRSTLSGGDDSGAPKIVPIIAIVLAALAVWALAVTLLGGHSEDRSSEESGKSGTTSQVARFPGPSPTTGQSTGSQPSTTENASDPTAVPTSEDSPGALEVNRNNGTPAPNESGRSNESSGANGPATTPEPAEGQVIVEGTPKYNPLGKEVEPNSLTETQRDRLELAASQFVVHAYGFTGRGEKARYDYEAGLSRSVVAPVFYESPGAVALASLADQIETKGVAGTAYLDSFDVSRVEPKTVQGTLRFTVETPDGSDSYAQKVDLKNSGAIWRVAKAGKIQGQEGG